MKLSNRFWNNLSYVQKYHVATKRPNSPRHLNPYKIKRNLTLDSRSVIICLSIRARSAIKFILLFKKIPFDFSTLGHFLWRQFFLVIPVFHVQALVQGRQLAAFSQLPQGDLHGGGRHLEHVRHQVVAPLLVLVGGRNGFL